MKRDGGDWTPAWCDFLAILVGGFIWISQPQLQLYSPWKVFFFIWAFLRVIDGALNGPNRRAAAKDAREEALKRRPWWEG